MEKEYLFLVSYEELTNYMPQQLLKLEKFVRVFASNVDAAYKKMHNWAKGTKYHYAHVKKFELLEEIEIIK